VGRPTELARSQESGLRQQQQRDNQPNNIGRNYGFFRDTPLRNPENFVTRRSTQLHVACTTATSWTENYKSTSHLHLFFLEAIVLTSAAMKQSLLFLLALATIIFLPKHVAGTAHNVFASRMSKDGQKLVKGGPKPPPDKNLASAASIAPPVHVPSDAPSFVPSDAPSNLPSDLPSVFVPQEIPTAKCRENKRSKKGKQSMHKAHDERDSTQDECGKDTVARNDVNVTRESAEDALNASSAVAAGSMALFAVSVMTMAAATGWIIAW
jgi:hypothetical protein